ncbi:major facilitator superfamily domain-containing protein 6-like [Parasteatoda tepidariorum]|uniref:major facilitator superfamily domain-containing protein 6-like n=1 Tax=Parasteatoda tepidariorum TaxID=114398 RepID=UPI00077FBDFB|nr:major facilitator superfamily domain-containing protein 6-like [Parasteatoda tepidariorum]XP_042907972.1 major facilitator superfamily domain-containing protein 6-like [Parasteatoda tepidariorum]
MKSEAEMVSNNEIKTKGDEKKGEKKFFAIDKKMWRFKLHFFLFIGGIATVFPYLPHYANKNIGISFTAIAIIFMVQQFLFIVTKTIIGYLADYFNQLKAMICILTVTQGLSFALILIIPKIEHTVTSTANNSSCYLEHLEKFFDPELSFLKTDDEMISFCGELDLEQNPVLNCERDLCDRVCLCTQINDSRCCFSLKKRGNFSQEYIKNHTTMHCSCPEEPPEDATQINEFLSYQFWLFAFIHTLGMVCNNAVFTLSDTACCESVEKTGTNFGRQRLWGAIGWGLLAPLGGLLNDCTESYIPSWMFMEVCLCFVIWNILKLELEKPTFSKNIMKDVGTVLKSGEFLIFEAGLLMNGIGAALIWSYLVMFLISIGASKLLCGLSLTVQSFLGTLPLMYFSGAIIKKLGHLNVCSLALILYTVRFLWYSYLYNPWLVLIVELLHGFTYGLLYTNIASFGKESAKPGTEATTQSLLFGTHEGLGGGFGCVLGGLGLDLVGGRQTFFIASLFTGCGFLLHQLSIRLVQRRKGNIKITPEFTPTVETNHKI